MTEKNRVTRLNSSSPRLINQNPLMVLPDLVMVVGLERAIILQQIQFLLQQPKSGEIIDGEKYIWKTATEFSEEYFPFWKEQNIKKHLKELERVGILIAIHPKRSNFNNTKYYRINYENLENLLSSNLYDDIDSEDYQSIDSSSIITNNNRSISLENPKEIDSQQSTPEKPKDQIRNFFEGLDLGTLTVEDVQILKRKQRAENRKHKVGPTYNVPEGLIGLRLPKFSGTIIPDDFKVPEEEYEKAKTLFPNLDVRVETMKFKKHYLSTQKRYANWLERWKGWIIQSNEYAKQKGPSFVPKSKGSKIPTLEEQIADIQQNSPFK